MYIHMIYDTGASLSLWSDAVHGGRSEGYM